MSAESIQTLMLFDEVERVLANPTASPAWQALLQAYDHAPDETARASARDVLAASKIDDAIGRFFQATFLADLPGGEAHIAEAGRLAQSIQPMDPERLMAFAAFQWGRAVTAVSGREAFVRRLCEAQVPQILALAGAKLADSGGGLAFRQIDKVRRVALVAPFLGRADHPPTVLALQHARLLIRAGIEVAAFSGQEALMPRMPDYLGNSGRILAGAPDLDQLAEIAPAGLSIGLSDPTFSLTHRWREILAAIAQFDPDLVLFVGLYSPLVSALHADRPVLGLCTHAVAPIAPVDAWLCADATLAGRATATWGNAIPPAWGVHHPHRLALNPIVPPVSRVHLQVSDDDFVMVSAGARLGAEINGDWAARMGALLAARPGCVWVLVGGEGVLPPALAALPTERLRLLPQQDGLRGVLRCCDLYINPGSRGRGPQRGRGHGRRPARRRAGGLGRRRQARRARQRRHGGLLRPPCRADRRPRRARRSG